MLHPRVEVFWQVTHHRDWQDDKCQEGVGVLACLELTEPLVLK